ncbi:hypothetical protein KDW99_08965 [Marinomonas rhizomae]|uniref:hypothetical protein n=1 Tax=Marinomonas rhizomae TaxID=491948 RepID=UPI002105C581|nr:hypothetical protein [Marinomonas rhizomae]UTW01238.1 hypothetical protein KDW99_08965 [Marinomonas rhizomae]
MNSSKLIIKKPWLYQLDHDYSYKHALFDGIEFENAWCMIRDGTLTIRANYAWDGCTPKVSFLGVWWVGVPDGILRLGKPWTYYASLIHDVLCQFRHKITISKQAVVKIFNDVLERDQFPLRPIYAWFVDKLGPQDFLIH